MTDELNKDLSQELEEDNIEIEPTNGSDDILVDEDAELSTGEVVKKLREKIKVAVEEKQKYLDSWQRDKAEFINARKRDEESKKEYVRFATEKFAEDILPILDAFDMAIGSKESWESAPAEWRKGVETIYQQLVGALAKHEVIPFGAIGEAFDPNFYHSIALVPTENKAQDHAVAEILQKGYKLKDKVLRPALVKVFEAEV
ncbi:MAG: nucleotide exchange factor GrpE [Patescibacteria group bacterium]